METSYIWWLLL
ncbi:hypothetical protein VTL71DRAFT_9708 [Oculimacula yallundae]|uniref:Uncharacterized protein n=1 Tax=Oculimacula yallundae TaxID=86028 RepID=A0ABR4BRK4_9HELO